MNVIAIDAMSGASPRLEIQLTDRNGGVGVSSTCGFAPSTPSTAWGDGGSRV
jgi:hypothetical protein